MNIRFFNLVERTYLITKAEVVTELSLNNKPQEKFICELLGHDGHEIGFTFNLSDNFFRKQKQQYEEVVPHLKAGTLLSARFIFYWHQDYLELAIESFRISKKTELAYPKTRDFVPISEEDFKHGRLLALIGGKITPTVPIRLDGQKLIALDADCFKAQNFYREEDDLAATPRQSLG